MIFQWFALTDYKIKLLHALSILTLRVAKSWLRKDSRKCWHPNMSTGIFNCLRLNCLNPKQLQ